MSLEYIEKIYHKVLDNRRTIEFFLKIAIAASLILFLINYISLNEITSVFATADYTLVIYAAVFSFVNLGLQALKWNLVVVNSIGRVNFSKIITSFLAGVTSGLSTPARVGEFIGRALPLKEHSFLDVTIASFVDKIINMLVITFFGALSAVLFYRVVSTPHFFIDVPLMMVIIALFAVVTYIFFSRGFLLFLLKKRFSNKQRIISKISVVKNFLSLSSKKKILIASINLIYYLVILFQFYLLVKAFFPDAELLNLMLVASLILFATTVIVPFSFGDLGVREGAASYLVALVGIPSAIGFNAALVLFVINVIFPSLLGLFFLVKNK